MEKTPHQMSVEQSLHNGAKIEWRRYGSDDWIELPSPLFDWCFGEYRVKSMDEDQPLYHHSETQDEIPWSAINPRFRHSAREPNGMIFVYENAPELIGQGWSKRGFNMRIDHILNCVMGSVDWAAALKSATKRLGLQPPALPDTMPKLPKSRTGWKNWRPKSGHCDRHQRPGFNVSAALRGGFALFGGCK